MAGTHHPKARRRSTLSAGPSDDNPPSALSKPVERGAQLSPFAAFAGLATHDARSIACTLRISKSNRG